VSEIFISDFNIQFTMPFKGNRDASQHPEHLLRR